jgi:hypothetical protein
MFYTFKKKISFSSWKGGNLSTVSAVAGNNFLLLVGGGGESGALLFSELSTILFNNVKKLSCGAPAISLHSCTVPLVQWSTLLLPVMRGLGSIPRGVLM